MAKVVSLTTDFGNQDSYVAEMKAVILAGPLVTLVDLTHQIPAFDIQAGAFQLLRAYRHFPPGSIHLAVVDPGVGSSRKSVYVKAGNCHFVGPDNGVLKWAVEDAEKRQSKKSAIYEIPVSTQVSATFHGRDLFAPFVVKLIRNRTPKMKKLVSLQGLSFPTLPQLIAIDHYGNLITSVPAEEDLKLQLDGHQEIFTVAASYSEIDDNEARLVRGSHGFWEISCREASAEKRFSAAVGQKIVVAH